MSVNKGTASFKQNPYREMTGHTSAKNPTKVGFQQTPGREKGKTSSAKNKGEQPFAQTPGRKMTGNSSGKNAGKAGFGQNPSLGGKEATVSYADKQGVVAGAKATGYTDPTPKTSAKAGVKMRSIEDMKKYRKKTYGI